MEMKINGVSYDTKKAHLIGGTLTDWDNCNLLFRRGNGQYFVASGNHRIVPMTIYEAITWGKNNLSDVEFKDEFGASKEDFASLANATTKHERLIRKHDGAYFQDDILTTRIPLHVLDDNSWALLNYWWVEEFDYGRLDWKNGEFVLINEITHPVPKDYALDILKDPDTEDGT